MKFAVTFKMLGVLLMIFSLSMLTPVPVSYYFQDHDAIPFFSAFVVTFGVGLILWFVYRKAEDELKMREGFVIVFLMWLVLGVFGALPFLLSQSIKIPWSDALFESISGLTTTGATSLTHLDDLPKSILYYRQQLEFLGGVGIIVLAVAIMPIIGVGGMQLYKAETSGIVKDNKLTPRITETAKSLWMIYVGLTLFCAIAYWFCGMSPFDAISYAFSTVSTGGFSPHDASIAYYSSVWIYGVAMIFMVLGAISFSLHFMVFRRFRFGAYFKDLECRVFFYVLFIAIIVVVFVLLEHHVYQSFSRAILQAIFQVVSFSTTSGFVSEAHYSTWPLFLPMLLILLGMLGACAGSTTGGIKIIRVILLGLQVGREVKCLIHPSGMFPVKVNDQVIPDRVRNSVWAFLSAYILIFLIIWFILMATGVDFKTALSASAACLSNIGPGLGNVADNYSHIGALSRVVLAFAMLLGRLEIFTILVLLSPSFWRD